ncbi:hypothetical protein Nepgr_024926 [Nepenthes gracilis]|uniref:E3 ubiquitin-protein ligase n=1 Tax=Nepenthes gracilis TaxID=150966 RepID=A0AAD3XZ84_NEPGR|nr:hypothetical protein Nepgr_024926 [Nepenthes gracilis]
MEVDSPSFPGGSLSAHDRIKQRLAMHGVPEQYIKEDQSGLVAIVKNNKVQMPELVSAILPTDDEVAEALHQAKSGSRRALESPMLKDIFSESMVWLQWLMFEGEPHRSLENLRNMSTGQRGVCGAVWGKGDIAFRCRTCEHDPTCAICVPCFQNGNHKGHDYSISYTHCGCCDCGDETAWKREGFCSKHKGAEQIQPLPEDVAHSVEPVLDPLFVCWNDRLTVVERISTEDPRVSDHAVVLSNVANELTFAIVHMLLDFCLHSESLLSFVSKKLINSGLLNVLVRAERFLTDAVTKKLHELLLKLLGEPAFKYEFAKVFVNYYPVSINEAIQSCSDAVLKKYPLLSIFCVQIFTVPNLTPCLVKEMNLLAMLLECLVEVFLSCSGEDGHLQVDKWGNLFDTSIHIIEGIRFVVSHSEVAEYVMHERQDISTAWVRILSFVQGMNPQKRETGIHVEEESKHMHLPFVLCDCIAGINSLFLSGAFAVSTDKERCQLTSSTSRLEKDDEIGQRRAKVGRLFQESSVCTSAGYSGTSGASCQDSEAKSDDYNHLLVPSSVSWLVIVCLRALDCWLVADNSSAAFDMLAPGDGGICSSNFLAFKKAFSNIMKGNKILGLYDRSSLPHKGSCSVNVAKQCSTDGFQVSPTSADNVGQDRQSLDIGEMDVDTSYDPTDFDDDIMEECDSDSEVFNILCLTDWPSINYDVSSQEISLHIPVHGLLSFILKEALRKCYADSLSPDTMNTNPTSLLLLAHCNFFGQLLKGCHPYGFSSFLMEHPLRIRVFCAQVHAGMWKKNGDAATLSCEWYHSVRWSPYELELHLFLLQICAALAPADLYVRRILERFGLSSYLSLDLKQSNEYEPVLVQEMLTLIIQIVQERRFCGLTASENLQRELVCKLATGDATHSQLVKFLPWDLSKLDHLQETLDKIANYSNPSGMNQGKYSLRFPYWKELDLYHPRWNRRDLQVAEERYLRFCGVSTLSTQLPKWTRIYPPLRGIARIATCNMVLQIIRAVLFYFVFSDKSSQSRAPEGVLVTALHLLSLALDICSVHRESGHHSIHDEDLIPLLDFAGEEINMGLRKETSQQSLLSLLVLLMKMHNKENPNNFMEGENFNLSSLIESILKKLAELNSRFMIKLKQIAPEVVNHLFQSADAKDSSILWSASDSEKQKAKAREKQAAILAKMRAEQSKFLESLKADADKLSNDLRHGKADHAFDGGLDSVDSDHDICSLCHDASSENPVSFLVLLQRSRLVSFVDKGAPSWDPDWKAAPDRGKAGVTANEMGKPSRRNVVETSTETMSPSQLSQIAQSAVNEFARDWCPAEVNAFIDYLKSQIPVLRNIGLHCKSGETKEYNVNSFESLEQDMFLSIQKGIGSSDSGSVTFKDGKEVSAEERTINSPDVDSILLGKYLAALGRESIENSSASNNGISRAMESSVQTPPYDGFGPMGCDGIHLSSCGHVVHQGCLDRYLLSLKERHIRRTVFEGGHIIDPDQGEFLCPVCRRLANSILPAVPRDSNKLDSAVFLEKSCNSNSGPLCFVGSLSGSNEEINALQLQHATSLLKTAASLVSKGKIFQAFPVKYNRRIEQNLKPAFRVLCGMYFQGKQDIFSRSGRVSPSLIMWDTLKYSLISTEIAARCGRTDMTSATGLSYLYKELRSSGGFILHLLLRIVRSTRCKNSLDVLLRFRGIQLLAASVCSGVHFDESSGGILTKEGGKISYLLKHIDGDESFSDMQFWNDASGPVLARDPFSTLMWTLFCLPYPILSSRESVLSLVHIFYAVSVTQAVIAYCGKCQSNVAKLGFHDCLVADVDKLIGESAVAQQYFVSNYIDPTCQMKDVIRRMCFPYLRRCALLWRVLNPSVSTPILSSSQVFDITSDVADGIETCNLVGELNEVSDLEKMFGIPPLNAVLDDEMLRSLAQKWLLHLRVQFEHEHCSIQRILHLTPTVPFQLMRLPLVYQDILQRYIKARCPDCKTVQDDPALCLLCGRLCSPSWKQCCRESGCQAHAVSCGAGTGVFLRIRKTTILLQRNARQVPWPSPYLDAFGEEDVEMHRGKPLYLNEERYAALTFMVASHGLDRSSKIIKRCGLPATRLLLATHNALYNEVIQSA